MYIDFRNSNERTATNILSNRLSMLEALGIINKGKMEGKELLPVILEIAQWSHNNLNGYLKDGAKLF